MINTNTQSSGFVLAVRWTCGTRWEVLWEIKFKVHHTQVRVCRVAPDGLRRHRLPPLLRLGQVAALLAVRRRPGRALLRGRDDCPRVGPFQVPGRPGLGKEGSGVPGSRIFHKRGRLDTSGFLRCYVLVMGSNVPYARRCMRGSQLTPPG